MTKHTNVTVSGKVQGVFFRAAAREKADELGVKGFVRNEPNGTVYAEAEGNENDLTAFLEWMKEGPPGASVKDVSLEDDEIRNYREFTVKH